VRQVTQRLRDGRIAVVEVPPPELRPEGVLVAVRSSLLSTGTERKKLEDARKSLLGKARSRPDEVRKVVEKARSEGLAETVQAVRTRLDRPGELGYSAAGVVTAAGARVSDLLPGDRVACGGGGYAVHAEIDYVPANLAVRIPEGVDFDAAAFATVGSIALHAVRQADVRLGERVAVIGLGLVGQLAGQILRAAGCRVVGVDLSDELVSRALRDGAADAAFSRGELGTTLPPDAGGCDAVLVTAATSSSDPVTLAAELARDRARIVLVGDVGMDVPRGKYYDKELELRMSRSYGPGRYDQEYEERGLDYPIGYVRWTERRNMAAFLELVAGGKVDVEPLISERVAIEDAVEAYERLVASSPSPLGIVLRYPAEPEPAPVAPAPARRVEQSAATVGVIGAGSFASRILIPGLAAAGFELRAVASAKGLSARSAADRFAFERAASVDELLSDEAVDCVVVATRHGSHAALASAALSAGKAVFVEKPPALTNEELEGLRRVRAESGRVLAVGFNRRHAPFALALRDHVRRPDVPFQLLYRVAAGRLPPDHWLNDPDEGGGRLLGEGCHFVDFACWFADAPPVRVSATLGPDQGRRLASAQSFTVTLGFADGSLAAIVYAADGAQAVGKEYVEAHAGGRSGVLDDFRLLKLLGPGARTLRERRRDKGHRAQLLALRRALEEGAQPLPDPLDSMAATLAALRSAGAGEAVELPSAAADGG
jgi:predicted dehydrogenase/threonine dehydrogenase-like Zn-dependent dehydrogenase